MFTVWCRTVTLLILIPSAGRPNEGRQSSATQLDWRRHHGVGTWPHGKQGCISVHIQYKYSIDLTDGVGERYVAAMQCAVLVLRIGFDLTHEPGYASSICSRPTREVRITQQSEP